ncbi:MAG TPA: DUF2007 domain-containing protein [Edaphocola sp.]|nr:DUF2007 domain-containing protein [Edaphocola sp.]
MGRFATLEVYYDYFIANIRKQVLLENGIECTLLNEYSGTMLPALAIGGIKLLVLEEDEEKARALLAQLDAEADANEEKEENKDN